MKMRKYQRSEFLENVIDQEPYEKWLQRKAKAVRLVSQAGLDTPFRMSSSLLRSLE